MNTEMTFRTVCASGEETAALGEHLGSKCQGGEIFELIGDLGVGKTAFVKGLAKGLGISDEVTSPSFTINNVYKGASFSLQHFDFYRLNEPGILSEEFKEAVFDPGNVIAVEWGNVVDSILPKTHITVTIRLTDNDAREFYFQCPRTLSYVFKGVLE